MINIYWQRSVQQDHSGKKLMEIIHFNNPLEFQERIRGYLLQHEAENNLPLGILASIISGEYLENPPYLGLVEDDGKPCLVIMCTPPFPVLFSYQETPPACDTLTEVLLDLNEQLGKDFNGVTGNKSLSLKLMNLWGELTGVQARLKMALRIYKLEQVKPVTGVPGMMRPAQLEDKELLLGWYKKFHRDGLHEEPDPPQVEKQVSHYLQADPQQRGLMIWEVGGKPVSMAGYAGPTPHGIRIGAVFTPSRQRGKGYASACTASLSQHLLDQGFQFCFLFTDLLNPTSNHIYKQMGYEEVCDVDQYDFPKYKGKEDQI